MAIVALRTTARSSTLGGTKLRFYAFFLLSSPRSLPYPPTECYKVETVFAAVRGVRDVGQPYLSVKHCHRHHMVISAAFVWWFNLVSPTLRPPIVGDDVTSGDVKTEKLGQHIATYTTTRKLSNVISILYNITPTRKLTSCLMRISRHMKNKHDEQKCILYADKVFS